MKTISNFEKIKPAVGIAENNRFGRVIHDNAGYLCAKYTNVIGLGINNVRCIGDNIISQPCIVIYCQIARNNKRMSLRSEGRYGNVWNKYGV